MTTKNRKKPFGKFIKKSRSTEKVADDQHVKHYVLKKFRDYPGENALLIELLVQDYLQFNNKELNAESVREQVVEAVNEEKLNGYH